MKPRSVAHQMPSQDTIVEESEAPAKSEKARASLAPAQGRRQSLRASLRARDSKAIAEEPTDCLGRRVTQVPSHRLAVPEA